MAEYAKGYNRKHSDAKSMIIFWSVVVAVIVIILIGAFLIGKIGKDNRTYAKYAENTISDYATVLTQEEEKYLIYFYTADDSLQTTVLDFIDAYEENGVKVYLVDFAALTTENKTAIESSIGVAPATTMLVPVVDNAQPAANRIIKTDTLIKGILKDITDGEAWFEFGGNN